MKKILILVCAVGLFVSQIHPTQAMSSANKQKLQQALQERDDCIAAYQIDYPEDSEQFYAAYSNLEWDCTLEKQQDYPGTDSPPTYITNLCVRTNYVSYYSRTDGIAGSLNRETLKFFHDHDMLHGITIDDNDTIHVGKKLMRKWKTTCHETMDLN